MHTYYSNLFITSNATRKILGRLSNCLPTPMLASQNHIGLLTLNWVHMYLLQIQLLLPATLTSSVKEIKKIMAVFLKDYFGLSVNSRLSQDHSCCQLPHGAAQIHFDTLQWIHLDTLQQIHLCSMRSLGTFGKGFGTCHFEY